MSFRSDDRGVSPIIAYILSFGIASGLLVVVVLTSTDALDRRYHDAARIEFEDLATRVANAVEEAVYVVDSNPDADYEKRMPLPPRIRGLSYRIEVTSEDAYVNATNSKVEVETVIHNAQDLTVSGSIPAQEFGRLVHEPSSGKITLEGGE